jgi:hypothetical protein
LPVLVTIAWLIGTWQLGFGGHDIGDMLQWGLPLEYRARITEVALVAWFVGLLATMVVADLVYGRFFVPRIDRSKVHWSRLRNGDGQFICAACESIFLLPPEPLSDEGWATCGDCGHKVAPFGEMKPYILEIRARLLSRLRRGM